MGDFSKEKKVIYVRIDQLHDFEKNPYVPDTDSDEFKKIVKSIQENDNIEPIVVHIRQQGGYTIVSGHRRKAAFQKLGIEEVPVIVIGNIDDSEDTVANLVIAANVRREHISTGDRARYYKLMLDTPDPSGKKRTITSIAREEGKNRKTLERALSLANNLKPDLLKICDVGKKLPSSAALELVGLNDEQQRALSSVLAEKDRYRLSIKKAKKVKELADSGELNENGIREILKECDKKGNDPKAHTKRDDSTQFVLTQGDVEGYLKEGETLEELRKVILQFLAERREKGKGQMDMMSSGHEAVSENVIEAA